MKKESSVPLSIHTTFRTGGLARFFVEAESVEDVRAAIACAQSEVLPFLVLGEGSNVLISDDGFPGYVIIPKILGIEFVENTSTSDTDEKMLQNSVVVVVGAGVHWDDLVAETVLKNLSGLENLSWIPGSVGAAPVQNIGAYGAEIKDSLEWVEVIDSRDAKKVQKISREECRFEYRESFFKTLEGKHFIITRVAFKLQKNGKPNISYKDLNNFFADKTSRGEVPSVAEVRNAVIQIRKAKLPDVAKLGTAGSFFKNPIISPAEYEVLVQKFPELPYFPAESSGAGFKKIPLAWVLDKVCGLNGFREGNVGLFETQPLALVNFGGATTTEIKNFAKKISDIVREKTNLNIEWEVNEINFKK